MADLKVRFTIDGRLISLEEIAEVERKRTVHVLREMHALGADLRVDGKVATPGSIERLDPGAAKALLVDMTFSFGAEGMRRLVEYRIAHLHQRHNRATQGGVALACQRRR